MVSAIYWSILKLKVRKFYLKKCVCSLSTCKCTHWSVLYCSRLQTINHGMRLQLLQVSWCIIIITAAAWSTAWKIVCLHTAHVFNRLHTLSYSHAALQLTLTPTNLNIPITSACLSTKNVCNCILRVILCSLRWLNLEAIFTEGGRSPLTTQRLTIDQAHNWCLNLHLIQKLGLGSGLRLVSFQENRKYLNWRVGPNMIATECVK